MKKKKLFVEMDAQLHNNIKSIAASIGYTIKEYVTEILKREVSNDIGRIKIEHVKE